jgi:hypothetical protein
MKSFQDYQNEGQSEMFERLGVFFAFGTEQFDEAKKEGVKYVTLGQGLVCPIENAEKVAEGLAAIFDKAVAQRKAEHTKEEIILHELYNHECFYTGDYEDAFNSLERYGYSNEDIKAVYYRERSK